METQRQLNQKLRKELEESREETKRAKRKLDEEKMDRDAVEARYTQVLRKMED